jgi:chemotaxis protein CheX
MRAEFISPFLQAARQVLESELASEPKRGAIGLGRSAYPQQGRDGRCRRHGRGDWHGPHLDAGRGHPRRRQQDDRPGVPQLDHLAQNGIGEIGNVITGRAAVLLAEAGFPSDIAPPMLIVGRGTMLTTLAIQRVAMPLETEFGPIEVQVALDEAATATRHAAAQQLEPRAAIRFGTDRAPERIRRRSRLAEPPQPGT